MRIVRTIGTRLVLALACLGLLATTGGQADAQYYRHWHGYNNYPYYWNTRGVYVSPYRAYSPYTNWYGNYGGYYWRYPYYNSVATYPWGWYW